MKPACRDFRAELERRLSAAREVEALAELGWHEHLLACADCRALLAGEEALEHLLASLPNPKLPRRLAERLILRLREARAEERALDALLELDLGTMAPARLAERVKQGVDARAAREERALDALLARDRVEPPSGLAARVLAGIGVRNAASEARLDELLARNEVAAPRELPARLFAAVRAEEARVEARLDSLLDRDRVAVPHDLASRVIAGVRVPEPALASVRSIAAARTQRARRVPNWVLAAAAALVVLFAVWRFVASKGAADAPPIVHEGPTPHRAQQAQLPGPEVLAALDVLEQWELLVGEDVDLLLSTIEPADESLLEEAVEAPAEDAPKDASKTPEVRRG